MTHSTTVLEPVSTGIAPTPEPADFRAYLLRLATTLDDGTRAGSLAAGALTELAREVRGFQSSAGQPISAVVFEDRRDALAQAY